MRTSRAVVMAIGIAASGCSLLTSLDGLTGGVRADATDGGASDGGDAAVDGRSDAAGDAAQTTDASDAAPTSYECPETGTLLCDHFERDTVVGDWGSPFTNSGGIVDLDTSTFTSPMRSLVIHLPTVGSARAGLGSIDYPSVGHVRAAFSMKTALPNRQVSIFRLGLTVGGTTSVLDLYMLPDGFAVQEQVFVDGGGFTNYPVTSGFQPNVWQRWTLELDATVSPAVGILTLDGVEKIRTPLNGTYAKGTLSAILGAYYAPDGPTRDVWYDDVAITTLP